MTKRHAEVIKMLKINALYGINPKDESEAFSEESNSFYVRALATEMD